MTELLAPPPTTSDATAAEPRRPASRRGPRRRVLVVVDEICTAPELCASVRTHAGNEPIDALVIAPAHGSIATQWYVDEDAARADATHRLRTCVACLAADGIQAEGRLSDPDPAQAIADALHTFPADEILFITGPQRRSTWLRQNAIDRVRRSFDQPVEHVVMPVGRPGAGDVGGDDR
ncbi:MAG TPA: hypothetical protein VLD16_14530 [Gaiellaceae bacterium]|nr:hypothetical protein [Gaiellaceae bacterium]